MKNGVNIAYCYNKFNHGFYEETKADSNFSVSELLDTETEKQLEKMLFQMLKDNSDSAINFTLIVDSKAIAGVNVSRDYKDGNAALRITQIEYHGDIPNYDSPVWFDIEKKHFKNAFTGVISGANKAMLEMIA